jgi:hypothetical protein
MYTQVWTKYLPVIKILLKRAVNQNNQTLDTNRIDFERAGSGRKAGYKFNIDFAKGRIDNIVSTSPLARDLAAVMMQDDSIKEIVSKNDYKITFNTKFQLNIKCLSEEQATESVS